MKSLLILLSLAVVAGVCRAQARCSTLTLGAGGSLNGFIPMPNDAWHQDISGMSVDPNSTTILTSAINLNSARLHPDFSNITDGAAGIPYVVIDSSQTPSVPVRITEYPDESDITIAPVPANPPIEGSPGTCPNDSNDRHLLVLDRNGCVDYEYYQAASCNGAWTASSAAVWDMTLTEKRPFAYGSADAAGLSIFEGLVRYDEVIAGSINHALRFTAQHTKISDQGDDFVAPANHAAGNLSSTDNIIGMRLRLKASFDISGYSATNQIILKAMKKYGMILADIGSNMFFTGAPDSRWDDNDLASLQNITATSFDVLTLGTIYTSSYVPAGAAPVIGSFTASPATIAPGDTVTLTSTVTGASYSYIDNAGFTRGSITAKPTATTTYTLTSRNEFGSTSATATVTVQSSGVAPTLTINSIATQTFGATPLTVSATSNSPGAITFSIVSGLATIAGSTVTLTGPGTVVVKAEQVAVGAYTAATATTSFVVVATSTLSVSGVTPPATVGVASSVTVTAQDSTGATLAGFTGIVVFSSSDPSANLPAAYAFQASDAGSHTFSVTFHTVGTQSLTAISGSVSGSQTGILVDGVIWVLNNTGTLGRLSVAGTLLTNNIGVAAPPSTRGGVAFDNNGNAWSVTSSSNTVNFATRDGLGSTNFSGGGLGAPASVAVDGAGQVWVANFSGNSVSAFTANGTALSGANGYGGSQAPGNVPIGASPSALAIDSSGGIWVASGTAGTVTHIIGAAAPVTTPIVKAVAESSLGTKP